MTRRRWLIVLGVVALALAVTLVAIDPSREDEGNPGIISWEFAWNQNGAEGILDDWGQEGIDAARLSLRLDYLYLLAYGALFALAAAATRDLAAERRWMRMAAFGTIAIWCAIGGALFDAVENVFLLISLNRHGGDLPPMLGSVFSSGKFLLLAIAQVYILAGLVMRLRDRRRRASGGQRLNQRPSRANSLRP